MRGWRNRQTRTVEGRVVNNHVGSTPIPRTIEKSPRFRAFLALGAQNEELFFHAVLAVMSQECHTGKFFEQIKNAISLVKSR